MNYSNPSIFVGAVMWGIPILIVLVGIGLAQVSAMNSTLREILEILEANAKQPEKKDDRHHVASDECPPNPMSHTAGF